MKLIAIPTKDGVVDDHFGHCSYYTVFYVNANNLVEKTERLDSPEGCGCKSNIASVMKDMGISVMLAGNMGDGALNKLGSNGINVIRGCSGNINEVLNSYLNGTLKDSEISCKHHDCENNGGAFTYVKE